MKRAAKPRRRSRLAFAAGTLIAYLLLGLVLLAMMERQPTSFIYITF